MRRRVRWARYLIFLTLGTICCMQAEAQSPAQLKKRAYQAIDRGDYHQAISDLQIAMAAGGVDPEFMAYYGVAAFHVGMSYDAELMLNEAWARMGQDMPVEAALASGRLQSIKNEPRQAIRWYKRALSLKGLQSTDEQRALLGIEHALQALRVSSDTSVAIHRLDSMVNTEADERYPSGSTERFLGYQRRTRGAYSGRDAKTYHYVDTTMQPVEKIQIKWLDDLYDGRFTQDGQYWVSLPFDEKSIHAIIDLQEEQLDTLLNLVPPYFPEFGDKSWVQISSNRYMFASTRPGGYGGYDLYSTNRLEDGWSAPLNLGPSVNSPYDDIDPCLASGGAELVYSSNRPASMGGFDLFVSRYSVAQQSWLEGDAYPPPINSSADEGGFYQAAFGQSYFHSNRDWSSGMDIYRIHSPDAPLPIAAAPKTGQRELTLTMPEKKQPRLSVAKTIRALIDSILLAKGEGLLTMPVQHTVSDIPPLFYGRRDPILNAQMTSTLDRLIQLHQTYGPLDLVLVMHRPNRSLSGKASEELTAKLYQEIRSYLQRRGQMNVDALHIMDVDNQMPFLDEESEEVLSGFDRVLDQRLDVRLVRRTAPFIDMRPMKEGLMSDKWHPEHVRQNEWLDEISFMIHTDRPAAGSPGAQMTIVRHQMGLGEPRFGYWVKDIDALMNLYDWLGQPDADQMKAYYHGYPLEAKDVEQLQHYFLDLKKFAAIKRILKSGS